MRQSQGRREKAVEVVEKAWRAHLATSSPSCGLSPTAQRSLSADSNGKETLQEENACIIDFKVLYRVIFIDFCDNVCNKH
jgi:hypothetical protein